MLAGYSEGKSAEGRGAAGTPLLAVGVAQNMLSWLQMLPETTAVGAAV